MKVFFLTVSTLALTLTRFFWPILVVTMSCVFVAGANDMSNLRVVNGVSVCVCMTVSVFLCVCDCVWRVLKGNSNAHTERR